MTTLAPAAAFALWAKAYDTTPNPLLHLEERMLGALLAALPGRRVVEIGCGTCRWRKHPALAGRRYAGIDASFPMLVRARSRGVAAGEAHRLPLGHEVADITLCSFTIAYCEELDGAFSELARVTRRGGAVVVSDLDPASGWERTFSHGGRSYRIAHSAYPIARLIAAARAAGLQLAEQRWAAFGEPERPLFRAAGREDLFAAASAMSAIWAGVWSRT